MATESLLTIRVPGARLEARLAAGARTELWLIAHPHPLYGGTLDDAVVCTARDALQAAGYATVRLAFRGVGRSSGAPGDPDEAAADLVAVLAQLGERPEAQAGLHLAGYSFGAWAAARALTLGVKAAVRSVMLFSPPVDFMDFADLAPPVPPCLITVGDRDAYCARGSLQEWLERRAPDAAAPSVTVLPGGDHFYSGHHAALGRAIQSFLQKI